MWLLLFLLRLLILQLWLLPQSLPLRPLLSLPPACLRLLVPLA